MRFKHNIHKQKNKIKLKTVMTHIVTEFYMRSMATSNRTVVVTISWLGGRVMHCNYTSYIPYLSKYNLSNPLCILLRTVMPENTDSIFAIQ
jgi:short-subunit dehydrogenase